MVVTSAENNITGVCGGGTTERGGSELRVKPCPHWRLADFGNYSRRKRRQFVAEFGDSCRFWRQSPNSATVVASVDRALEM